VIELGFTSEIKNYERVSLGETAHTFLSFFSQKEYSAYDMFKLMKEFKKPMTYKNVRMRIKDLRDLGIIEVTDNRYSRNAIKYKITTRGIFERLLMLPTVRPSFLDSNKRNVILQIILYQFFEEVTIRKFNNASRYLAAYLRDCCRAILDYLERDRQFLKIYKISFTKNEVLSIALDDLITNQARNFVLRILKDSMFEYQERNSEVDKKFRSSFPTWELARDKKFMSLLWKVKKDFDDGCQFFLRASQLP
jgi:hypothetical protein